MSFNKIKKQIDRGDKKDYSRIAFKKFTVLDKNNSIIEPNKPNTNTKNQEWYEYSKARKLIITHENGSVETIPVTHVSRHKDGSIIPYAESKWLVNFHGKHAIKEVPTVTNDIYPKLKELKFLATQCFSLSKDMKYYNLYSSIDTCLKSMDYFNINSKKLNKGSNKTYSTPNKSTFNHNEYNDNIDDDSKNNIEQENAIPAKEYTYN